MAAEGEAAVGVSLDSVVQKAAELEGLLRGCRDMTRGVGRGSQEGRKGASNLQSVGEYEYQTEPSNIPSDGPPNPLDIPPGEGLPKNGGVGAAWHQLASYIVGLEKQVQYYKSLVEGMQHAAVSFHQQEGLGGSPHMTGLDEADSPYVEGLFGHEESEPCSTHPLSQALGAHQEEEPVEDREARALILVFAYLSTAELCRVSRVCHQWRRASRHPLLWRTVSISETLLSRQALHSLSQLCGSTERITLHGAGCQWDSGTVQSVNSLAYPPAGLIPEMALCDEELQSYIHRLKGSLEGGVASLLAASGPTLLSLSITECNLMITDHVFWLAGVHCPRLQSFTYSSEEFPPTSESLWALAQGARHIQYLSLPPYISSPHSELFTDRNLSTLARSWPRLLGLCVGGNSITTGGLAEVAQFCPWLQDLEIQHGPQLNNTAVAELCQTGGLAVLRTLTLIFTDTSPKSLVLFLDNCPKLSSLTLHLSLETFFPGSPGPDSLSKYKKILTNLKELQRQPNIGHIIHLHEHYTQ